MTIVPMPGKLLVRRISPPTATESGILLPNTTPTHEALQRGVVLAVGGPKTSFGTAIGTGGYGVPAGITFETGTCWDHPQVEVDDIVVFPFRAGEEFVVDGTKVLLMRDEDVRAVEELERDA